MKKHPSMKKEKHFMPYLTLLLTLLLSIPALAEDYYKDGSSCDCDSLSRSYYESGALESETPYKNGKLEGTSKEYYESGALRYEAPFKKDKVEGTVKGYYDSGVLEYEDTYNKNKEREGTTKEYYESGSLVGEISFKKDKREGTSTWYFENGKLAGTAIYKNDTLVGYKKCTDGRFGNESLDCLQ